MNKKGISQKRIIALGIIAAISITSIGIIMASTASPISISHNINRDIGGERGIIWDVTLNFNEPGGKHDYVAFGEAPDANDGPPPDSYDVAKPPAPIPPYIRAWFDDNLPNPYNLLWEDYRKYPDTYKVWNLTVQWVPSSCISSTTVTISWDPEEVDDSEYTSVLLCNETGAPLSDMLLNDSYVFTCPDWTPQGFKIICSVNQPPEITCPGPQYVDEGSLLEFTVTATDPDGTTPALSAENLPFGASFTDHGDGTGTFSWTPLYNQSGVYDVIFNASDGELWDTCTVQITVNNVNRPPEANDDYATVEEDSLDNVIDVLANDTDPDNDPLTVLSVTDPPHGSVVNNGDNVSYTPDPDYCGDDLFAYTVGDGQDGTDTAMVYINVTCINDPPHRPDPPSGPTSGEAGVEYTYFAVTTDPEEDQIFYKFDWGDDSYSDWVGPYESGGEGNASHTWGKGSYEIRVKAKDIYDEESDWSDPLPVTMPLSQGLNAKESNVVSHPQQLNREATSVSSNQPSQDTFDSADTSLPTNPSSNSYNNGRSISGFPYLILRIIIGGYVI